MLSKKSSRTIPLGRVPAGTGTSWTEERVRPFIGQDVRAGFNGVGGTGRGIVGRLEGIVRRDGNPSAPASIAIRARSGDLVSISLAKLLNLVSTMEDNTVWDNNPMDLARLGYEAFRLKSNCQASHLKSSCEPFWDELTDEAKEAYLAFSEAVRHAVYQGR